MQGQLANITVYNMLGQVIGSQQKEMNGIEYIDLPLARGLYVVSASSEDLNFITKVINK